jgi:hypothetical protein
MKWRNCGLIYDTFVEGNKNHNETLIVANRHLNAEAYYNEPDYFVSSSFDERMR